MNRLIRYCHNRIIKKFDNVSAVIIIVGVATACYALAFEHLVWLAELLAILTAGLLAIITLGRR